LVSKQEVEEEEEEEWESVVYVRIQRITSYFLYDFTVTTGLNCCEQYYLSLGL